MRKYTTSASFYKFGRRAHVKFGKKPMIYNIQYEHTYARPSIHNKNFDIISVKGSHVSRNLQYNTKARTYNMNMPHWYDVREHNELNSYFARRSRGKFGDDYVLFAKK